MVMHAFFELLEVLFCWLFRRCPFCKKTLSVHIVDTRPDYCPRCGKHIANGKCEWYSDFQELNYLQGDLQVFEDHGETMLLVTYTDGMQIHVGYDFVKEQFVITALENDTQEAKDHPLAVHFVFSHEELLTVLQKTIHDMRDSRI